MEKTEELLREKVLKLKNDLYYRMHEIESIYSSLECGLTTVALSRIAELDRVIDSLDSILDS